VGAQLTAVSTAQVSGADGERTLQQKTVESLSAVPWSQRSVESHCQGCALPLQEKV
jgi:hypothetical protein